jgi:hypothetical protein
MTRSRTAPRRGFSRIDVAVAVVLGLTLLGLLTPRLVAARQKAARDATINNLKQLALGLHNHHDSYKRMPPAYAKVLGLKSDAALSIYLLPFIEQGPLYNMIREQGGGGERDQFEIDVFVSPLDKTNPKKPAGIQNFASNLRVFGNSKVKYDAAVPLADTMDAMASIPRTFTDGTSNTIVLATKYGVCGEGGSHYASPPKSKTGAFFGQNPAKVKAAAADPTATFQDRPSAKQCLHTPLMAQSYEAEGLLVALADGSTRVVSPRLSALTWNLALQPNDGMPLGKDWEN